MYESMGIALQEPRILKRSKINQGKNNMFQGYRSYIIGFLIVVVAGLKALGYINEAVFEALMAFLTGGGIVALRAAIAQK